MDTRTSQSSQSGSKTRSDSEAEFSEFILPGFKIVRRYKVKVYRRFDWLFFLSFQGITSLFGIGSCLIIILIVAFNTSNCPGKCFN